jgi:hypothetical protein
MAKLKLAAHPTFDAKVGIPVAGGAPVEVLLTFRHRTKDKLNEWIKGREGQEDLDTFMDMVAGWELDEPFERANVEILLQNHIGAALAAYLVYLDELTKHKQGN